MRRMRRRLGTKYLFLPIFSFFSLVVCVGLRYMRRVNTECLPSANFRSVILLTESWPVPFSAQVSYVYERIQRQRRVFAPRSGDGLWRANFFCLEVAGEEMPLGGEERAASVGLRRVAGGDCSVLKFWR